MRNSTKKYSGLWAVVAAVGVCMGLWGAVEVEAQSCPTSNRATCLAMYGSTAAGKAMCRRKCPNDYLPDDVVVHVKTAFARPVPPSSPFVFDGSAEPAALLDAMEFQRRQQSAWDILSSLIGTTRLAVDFRPFESDYEVFSLRGITFDQLMAIPGFGQSVRYVTKTQMRPAIAVAVGGKLAGLGGTSSPGSPSINPLQWGLRNNGGFNATDKDGRGYIGAADVDIEVDSAWTVEQQWVGTSAGRRRVLAVVIDTGFNLNSPDLQMNLFKNAKEIACDRIDNDGDGAVDNVSGWDAVLKTGCVASGALSEPDPNQKAHGTHVAATIAGMRQTADGATGVAPNVTIYPIKAYSSTGPTGPGFYSDHLVEAYKHVLSLKNAGYEIAVVNTSFGGPCSESSAQEDAALRDLVKAGISVVGAAGNAGANSDAKPLCPGNLGSSSAKPLGDLGIISVAASNPGPLSAIAGSTTSLLGWSNFGLKSVNVAAPGTAIYANGELRSGTSMAAPFVSGTVALMKSVCPLLTPAEIESIITNQANSKPLGFSVASRGILNAEAAVKAAAQRCVVACLTCGSGPAIKQEVRLLNQGFTIRSVTGRDGCAFFPNPNTNYVDVALMSGIGRAEIVQQQRQYNSATAAARVKFQVQSCLGS